MTVVFSANLGFLWKDRPFLDRIAAARAAGFTMVEFHDEAQREDPAAVREALRGMPVAGLNVRMGDTAGCAALAGAREQAQGDIAVAIETARTVGARAIHVLSGRTDDPAGGDRLAARLREAADAAPDLTFLIEPLCPQASPGYFLSTIEQAAEIIERVDRTNAKIMFDCFHVQRASGDILQRFRTHLPLVGHVQIASAPGRNEPDRGEINYPWLIPAMQDAGWAGPFGAEYIPTGAVDEGLSWRDAFT